ncbi:MAG TPA: maleylpyruvate isomerase family mycothiol-dependent enzyme [Intrasporangium sp.]|uniref:maleylpyruvate isomerase family mycothiol-dependent enzyme n=1 Tax=Intrasporangium sp. TaxID=1925024 RepID=UPI002B466B8F|nr:maleylpyruvate isomerase family mycothiol-dependent enzyme [Intrasporangium sp.]HKX68323.1 maleylpyruvate isomerase family mycothiol-dependent enzyme [Intrasporangium sp.]
MHLIDLSTEHLPSETERLVATAERLGDADVRAPSLCPGWTRGHVLTHLARNAEALSRVCAAVLTGEPDTMYDSVEARDADIESGAGRSAAELASDVRTQAAALAPQIIRLGVEHVGTTVERVPGGQLIAAERVPFMRLREVVWHHVDLDAGYGFADTPDELVHLFLVDTVARLASSDGAPGLAIRTDQDDEWTIGDGSTTIVGSRWGVLHWLARGRTDGLEEPAAPLPPLPFGG